MIALSWRGIDEVRFRKYKNFVNRQSPGICGTYSAGVMVHDRVLQDTGIYLNRQKLLDGMQQAVDDYHLHRGTFIWNIRNGLNLMLSETPYRAQVGFFTEKKLPALIDQGFGPFVVGTLGVLGSTYGNHWVLVYAYTFDKKGNLYFRCYNNHGRHDSIIKASETFCYAYLVNEAGTITAEKIMQATQIEDTSPIESGVRFIPNRNRELALVSKELLEKKQTSRKFLGKEWNEWKDMII